ncbi:ABC transporter substrate-binding protein [Enemella sp. A6]|uniref:ABC transporter substrate-binding protein n=1 Tax=Enemella sp. A6 TaxID=3440152 RepID=UPI003EB936E9
MSRSTMRSKFISLIGGLIAVAMIVTGCTGNGAGNGNGEGKSDTLVIGAVAHPPTMDAVTNDSAAIPQVLLYNVYETLVKMGSDGELQPLLAQRWEVSPDNLTYTFHLDPAAKFASGKDVTSSDVKHSIERIQAGGSVTNVLQGQMEVVESVDDSDKSVAVIKLKRPSNAWLYNMTSTGGMIFDAESDTDLATDTAGSGPYQLKQWNQGDSVVLERNEQYWATPQPFREVTFRYFTDPNAMNNAMLSGDLDIISNLQAPQAIDQFSDTSRFQIIEGTTSGEVVLAMNHENKALADVRVRRAIMHAIDRQALIDTVWNGHGTLIGSMASPTDPWYEDLSSEYDYDPEKAKKLLAEAGYANGLTLRLRLPVLPYATSGGQFVASQLREVGINATIDELEFPARWLDVVLTKADYDMTIVAHVEPRDMVKYADPKYYWRYNNPEFQKLMTEADAGSHDDYVAKMREGAKMLNEDAAANWLFLLPNLIVAREGINGLPENMTSLSFDLTNVTAR